MLDPNTTAFVFPGQGSQALGMGRELAEQFDSAGAVFARADDILGFALSSVMWAGPEAELNDTVNTQPALYVHSMAALAVLRERLPGFRPAFVAGHSLGELSAITAAGALTFADGLRLVRARGELMKAAGQEAPGGMAAILGLDIPTLERVCAEAGAGSETVQVANDNCPGQTVISGSRPALERALGLAKAAGAKRALPLAVSIAAHSELMRPAQLRFDERVAATEFALPAVAVVGNVSARPLETVEVLQADLRAQLTARVRWTETIRFLAGQGVTAFVEIGSGNVLTGLLKRIAPEAKGLALGTPGDLEGLN